MARVLNPRDLASSPTASTIWSQGHGRIHGYLIKCLVNGVVRTDDKLRSNGCELSCGGQHQSGYFGPVPGTDVNHVLTKGIACVSILQGAYALPYARAPLAQRTVAERRTLCTAGHNSYMFRHVLLR